MIIYMLPNEEVMRVFNKRGFTIEMGFPYYGWLVSIFSVIAQNIFII